MAFGRNILMSIVVQMKSLLTGPFQNTQTKIVEAARRDIFFILTNDLKSNITSVMTVGSLVALVMTLPPPPDRTIQKIFDQKYL